MRICHIFVANKNNKIMEVKLESGDRFRIPSGCIAVDSDGVVTIERNQYFVDGDFVVDDSIIKSGHILKSKHKKFLKYYVSMNNNGLRFNNVFRSFDLRLATEEEKQWLLDKLHAEGKDWDAENKRIIEYKWKPKDGEDY